MTIKSPTWDSLLSSFEEPLDHISGCRTRVVRRGDTYWVEAELTLRATRPIKNPDGVVLKHVADAEAYVRDLVDSQLRPLGQKLARAANAAAAAWNAVMA